MFSQFRIFKILYIHTKLYIFAQYLLWVGNQMVKIQQDVVSPPFLLLTSPLICIWFTSTIFLFTSFSLKWCENQLTR